MATYDLDQPINWPGVVVGDVLVKNDPAVTVRVGVSSVVPCSRFFISPEVE